MNQFLNENGIAEYIIKNNEYNNNILFIHGFTSKFLSREKTFEKFNMYNWYGIDFPNHGNSNNFPKNKLRVKYFSELVLDFIKKYQIEDNLIIIGHSMGGAIASIVAANLGTKIRILILEGPANLSVLENKKIIEKMISKDVNDLKDVFKSMIYKFKFKEHENELNQWVNYEFKKQQSNTVQDLSVMLEFKIWSKAMNLTQQKMRVIETRTIIIFGNKDEIVPFEKSYEILSQVLKNAKWEIIENISHLAFIENEKAYWTILKKYLI
ncbi:alpha/beta fold hydrolase [[Mycoplasma] mobile]|uniref:Triacylglycerol lipase 2 n=1 Tax=Mycoplasma mobile (strain ATCC 43663 / 163K / NCTC 11711) TaxID=267748 RepID=Q6KI90_MYCM1|nr:alpha/beta hydrolase [[Mycoplasma] mobile]AAT27686.1 triacylglycerol lipase 2 [Mycoplasma mobile 163K]